MLKDLSDIISADSDLASDLDLTKSTLEAVENILGSVNSQTDGIAEYQTMEEGTFESLASTVDSLISSSSHASIKDTALEVTAKLFKEGVNRLAGSMQAGVEGSAVKKF